MTQPTVTHASFAIERRYAVPPARVFAAFASPDAKARWFAGPGDWEAGRYELDFQVGGLERASGGPPDGPLQGYDARYLDIVPERRIVLAYELRLDELRVSVSLLTVEFAPEGTGTRLLLTEQGTWLDGYDDAGERERGTHELLDALDAELRRQAAA